MDETSSADIPETDVAAGQPDEAGEAAPVLTASGLVPQWPNPMTMDVTVQQGNRVISTLDLIAKRAAEKW